MAIACVDAKVLGVRNIAPVVAALWSGPIARGSAVATLPIYRASNVASIGGRLMRFRRPAGGLAGRRVATFRGELPALAVRRQQANAGVRQRPNRL